MLPEWLDAERLQWIILGVLGLLLYGMYLVTRLVREVITKFLLFVLLAGIGLFVPDHRYLSRAKLRASEPILRRPIRSVLDLMNAGSVKAAPHIKPHLSVHQLSLVAGSQSALKAAVEQLNPEKIEARASHWTRWPVMSSTC